MIDDEKFERLLRALESIADDLGHLGIISDSIESLASTAYEINEKIDAITGHVDNSERAYIRTCDIGRD